MQARDIMSTPVVTVTASTSSKRAAELLSSHGFTALPVVDEDDRLIGIVTEADLIQDRFPPDPRTRIFGQHAVSTLPSQTVGQVMTTPVTGMSPRCDVAELSRALLDARIRAMPIVDGARVVGIVTRGDLVRVFARDDAAIAADIRRRLEILGHAERWQVEVHDGVVRIRDEFDDETDRHVATVLAESVPGVLRAWTETVAKRGRQR